MKNYSFSNIAAQESYLTRKSNDFPTHHNHRHSELKNMEANSRIQEIKKKYDTPSRRQRIQSLKKSRDFVGQRVSSNEYSKQNHLQSKENNFVMKDSYSNYQAAPNFGGNHLKESFAVNRLEKSTLKHDINSKELDCIRNNDLNNYRTKMEKENNFKPFKSQSLDQEEIFISKVRQMKESIINNDYMRGSINPRSSISSANYSQMIDCNDDKRQFDPRVQNIDKINAKIKQILSCLAQSQKNPSKFLKDNTSYPNQRQATICVNKVQNTRGSYLNAERPRLSSDSSKHLSFFSKSGKQAETSSFNTKGDLKNIDSAEIKLRTVEGSNVYNKYQEKKSWLMSNTNNSNLQTKEVQKDIPSFNIMSNEVERKEKQYRDYSVNKIDSYVSKRANYHREQDLIKTPSYVQNKRGQPRSALAVSQSRSQIDSIRKSTLTDNEKTDVLKSGKKLNDQISKIQKKIQEFEAQKKKLNIQFTPFSMKNRSSSNLVAGARFQNHTSDKIEQKKKSQIKLPVPHFHSEHSQKDTKFTYQRNRASQSIISRSNVYNEDNSKNQISFGEESQAIIQESKVDQKMENVDVKTFRIEKGIDFEKKSNLNQPSISVNKPASYSFDEAALRKRTDQGIQERKKRLQTTDQIIKTDSLKKLIALFCQQAKLDQNFRNMKIWLESNFSKDKYSTISKILSKQGLNISQQQCESLFRVEQSENNPFFTSQGFDGSFEAVCKAYIECRSHWESKIKNKFDRQNLTSEGFTVKKIDLERKGFIELEDIVRLLNIQSGTFYRNRDIFLIFRRFTKGEKVNLEDILQQICI